VSVYAPPVGPRDARHRCLLRLFRPSPPVRANTGVRGSDPPPLDDLPCPPAELDPQTTVCPAERDDAPVVVRTNRRSISRREAESVRFVLENETGRELRFNPHNPDIYRYVGEKYDRLDRQSSGNGVTTVPSGGTYSWRLTDLAVFDQLSAGACLFAASVRTAGAMSADWVTCLSLSLSPFRLVDERG
jgi:hypothetical protein